jgi:hypothetical protein
VGANEVAVQAVFSLVLKRWLLRLFFRVWLFMSLGWLKTEEQSSHYRIAAFLCAPDFLILLALFPTNLKSIQNICMFKKI